MGARNRVVGRAASLCSLAGCYDNFIPTRFLSPIDCSEISALASKYRCEWGTSEKEYAVPSFCSIFILPQCVWAWRTPYPPPLRLKKKWRKACKIFVSDSKIILDVTIGDADIFFSCFSLTVLHWTTIYASFGSFGPMSCKGQGGTGSVYIVHEQIERRYFVRINHPTGC
jgi:hypothetical protein